MGDPVNAQFTLPLFPPPLSACFINAARNGRIVSDRYRAWKEGTDAALARCASKYLGIPGRPTFPGRVRVTYIARKPDNRLRDIDNLLKALNDTLTRNYIVRDDSLITDLRIRWAEENELQGVNPISVSIVEAV